MLGLVVPDITNPFFAELAHAVESAAAERGLLVTLGQHAAAARTWSASSSPTWPSRNVDGLLVSTVLTPAALAAVPRPHRPTVLMNVSTAVPGLRRCGLRRPPGRVRRGRAPARHARAHQRRADHRRVHRAAPRAARAGFADAFAAHGLPPGPVVRTDVQPARAATTPPARILAWRQPARRDLPVLRPAGRRGVPARCARPGSSAPTTSRSSPTTAPTSRSSAGRRCTSSRQPVEAHGPGRPDRPCSTRPSVPGHQQLPTELVVRRSCGCPARPHRPTRPLPSRRPDWTCPMPADLPPRPASPSPPPASASCST